MEGTEKQVAWADKIKAEELDSLWVAGETAPLFRAACDALAEAVSSIQDASWIIENRYTLGLTTGFIYGTDRPTIHALVVLNDQLLRNEHWREPRLRKGISTFTVERQTAIKDMFKHAWLLERGGRDHY